RAVRAARAAQKQTESAACGCASRAGQRDAPRALAIPDPFGEQFRSGGVDRVPGWVEGTAPVAGPWGVPRKGAADTGTRWRVLESSTGTGSGRCRLLQPDLVAAGTCGGGTGAADGGQARCDEAPDWQVGPGARGAGASEGRQPGPHAGGGREPGTVGGSETRHCGGVAQSEGGVKQA